MCFVTLVFFTLLLSMSVVNCEDIERELQKDIDSGRVIVLHESAVSVEHIIADPSPSLVVSCYTHGKIQRSIFSLWSTVQFQVLAESEVSVFYGLSKVDVYRQWRKDSQFFRFWFTPWNVDTLTVTPFNSTCIGASLANNKDFKIKLVVQAINHWSVTCFITGLVLFFAAKQLSINTVFHYGTGVTIGLLASVLILVFILTRFIPKKSVAYTALAVGFSLTAWLLQFVRQNLSYLLQSYLHCFVAYFAVAGVISFAICYYRGPVTNPRLNDIIKWFIQVIAVFLAYYSSYLPELSMTLFSVIVALSKLPQCFSLPGGLRKHWQRRFPPKRRLLSEEEYIAQGYEETCKALEELRQFCRSPSCNSWKTVGRLKSPAQFANWIEGTSDHISNSELLEHEENPSPQLSFDSLTDDDD